VFILSTSQEYPDFATDWRPVRHDFFMPIGIDEGPAGRNRRDMTIDTSTASPVQSRGITIVEILLVISVLVILVSFAVPGLDRATARSEMKAASEHVMHTIDSARNLARMTESTVVLHADLPGAGAEQRIRLSGPRLEAGTGFQEYRLPESIRLVPDHASFTFDERGLVQHPGSMILVSQTDEAISSVLRVE
jgi:type II secretory pathway pseudopilin PulG